MNEEIMENEIVETEDVENYEEPETESKGHIGTIAIGAIVAVGLGAAALLYKNKEKLKERNDRRKIEKLRKKGWIVSWPEEDIESITEDTEGTEEGEE